MGCGLGPFASFGLWGVLSLTETLGFIVVIFLLKSGCSFMFLRIAVLSHFFALLFVAVGAGAQALVYNGGGDTVVSCTACNGLAITIPADNSGTAVTGIGPGAFLNLSLTSVTLPNTLITIGDNAFKGNGLSTVTFPNTLTTIGIEAFEGSNLTTVTVPGNVVSIGFSAFGNNTLTNILFEGDRPTLPFLLFGGIPTINYRPATTGWPGGDIQFLTPTLLAFPPAGSAAAIPTLPSMFLMFLSLGMCLMAFKSGKLHFIKIPAI